MTTQSAKCPICGQPSAPAYRPFCSQRCADVDLGRWFGGNYRIAGEATPQDESEKAEINDKT
ncbi:DNA gyrase inhibitor YacG [Acetobacter syzygii]|uniref:DNA gyrase inhibitor YacG n=1 Tax=Acetobacter syzygii TaxID=146476 RepID=A0A270BQK8_9PROT|nr:DNA gyrase inhibitor YacG [Acetobacter syzygii]NSL93590.1 DNA gyrase inhibitor YacG [Acetobacter syzygii]PAL27300.1 DNA gyrase inhibitor YacG [Acetobacter syzygii]PAL27697.1 DNA gyrase inhibitor YacG [Acetobacter syzygii]GAN71108.1 hypothetical protein Absy_013_014 [Acetobacter syzygii]GEL57149.1 hypothetical protein ASY01nite_22150 [Acetobacter syzygii]